MVDFRYGVNNYKNSVKLQSLFLKDRRKLSIYRRFKDVVFHTNGRRLKLLFFFYLTWKGDYKNEINTRIHTTGK